MKDWQQYLEENANRLCDDAERIARGEKVIRHIPTGFSAIDNKFGGVRLGIATEVLAHTGDGKSSFLRQLVESGARNGAGVLWFIAEDPEDATAERQLAGDTNIDTMAIGRVDLGKPELARLKLAAKQATWGKRVCPVFGVQSGQEVLDAIDETTTIGGAPLQLVVIDYAQVLGNSRSLEDDVAELGKGLQHRSRKSDTNQREMASVIASQVTSAVVPQARDLFLKTQDMRRIIPGIGDTEYCRRLEKYTKALWSLVRPGRWLKEFGDDSAIDDYAELHVKKANFGVMGWAELSWNGPQCKFGDK